MDLAERLSLRSRISLFFALIGVVSVSILVAGGVWLGLRVSEEAFSHIVLILAVACFSIVGLVVWVAMKFDDNLAKPLVSIAADLKTIAHSDGKALRLDKEGRYLGLLAPAARDVSEALDVARNRTEKLIDEAMRDAASQKSQLEGLLRDLHQGLVICTMTGRVTLYNQRAVDILMVEEFVRGDSSSTPMVVGSLGLGRDFFNIVNANPFQSALELLNPSDQEANPLPLEDAGSTPIVFSTCDGAITMRGHVALRLNEAGNAPTGFVVVFDDITAELTAGLERDRVLREATTGLRESLDIDDVDEMRDAVQNTLLRLEHTAQNVISSAWPTHDLQARQIFGPLLASMSNDSSSIKLNVEGDETIINGDSATLIALLRKLIRTIDDRCGALSIDIKAQALGIERTITLTHDGKAPGDADWLDKALNENADENTAFLSGASILERHRATIDLHPNKANTLIISFPVNTATKAAAPAKPRLKPSDARPEFYDFKISSTRLPERLVDVPLSKLYCVVFDCEMTGLEPSRDEIVSIAGVRVVNGRVLTGETFNQFVNPGRPIPPASTKVHHITDQMVADAPHIDMALRRFHGFTHDQVLIAHNAAFDMAFVNKGQKKAGVSFDNTVLDTVLLAAHLHGVSDGLTLDDLAERFQVTIPEEARHTALGDALATAHVFAEMIKVLESSGVHTLSDALDVSQAQTAIRRRQQAYA